MRRVLLESDNEEALSLLTSQAREMQVAVVEDVQELEDTDPPLKVLTRASLKEIAGSLSDLDLDATDLRKKAWNREKSKF